MTEARARPGCTKISADPLFVDKVRDIVGLYMNPPEHAVVLCVDEKSKTADQIFENRSL